MAADFEQFTPIAEERYGEDGAILPARRPSSIGVSRPQLRSDNTLFEPPDTPNTFITLGEELIKPDLTIRCNDCDIYVEMCHLLEHRHFHQALLTLRYNAKNPPVTSAEITQRRKQMISEFHNNIDKNLDKIRKINQACDTVREHIARENRNLPRDFHKDYRMQEFVTATALDCSCQCVLSVGICSDPNGRYKATMEDRRVYQDYYGNDSGKTFLGLYDGYHGSFAAEVAANELHHVLLEELIRFDPNTTCTCTVNMVTDETSSDYDENRPYTGTSERVALHYASSNMVQSIIHTCAVNLANMDGKKEPKMEQNSPFSNLMSTAFVKSFNEIDRYLSYGMDEQSRTRWSGCSALTVLLKDIESENEDKIESESEDGKVKVKKLGEMHIAQAGDVRGVLVRGGRPYRLTKDHTLNNNRERNRVIKQGGTAIGSSKKSERVNGILESTRGLGNHGDPQLKKCVRVDPHTSTVPVDEFAEFLILASRGVWQIFSDQEMATIVGQMLPRNLDPPPSRTSTSLRSLLGLGHSRNSSAMDQTIDLDHNDLDPDKDHLDPDDDLQKDQPVNQDGQQEKVSRPNTSSRVSFNLASTVEIESGDRTPMPGSMARDQLRRDFAKQMSERLTHAAIMAGATDNITVIVVLFPGSGL